MTGIQIREFAYPADYQAALDLWETAGTGVHVGQSDSPAEIEKKLQRDSDLFLVAMDAGQLVGTVMGAFDGRRGMVYHLAVARAYRRKGIASRLMVEVERRLREKGCVKAYLLVRPDNDGAVAYYEAMGWSVADDIVLFREFK